MTDSNPQTKKTPGRIAISGAGGLIGAALVDYFDAAGSVVVPMVRQAHSSASNASDAVAWDIESRVIEAAKLEGVDAVVHLAGEQVVGRWTRAKRRRIERSRVLGTQLISRTLAKLKDPPKVMLCASAIAIYGDRGEQVLTESSSHAAAGDGFLLDVCRQWERATAPAQEAGIRVVHLRLGAVLSTKGGALRKMLLPFSMCLGGVLGSGRQWFSWIHIEDVLRAIEYCLADQRLSGPVNVVSPNPVTNRQFTRALGKALHRPTLVPVPALALRLILGQLADQLFLASARVQPACLEEAGFKFNYGELDAALEHLIEH